MQKVRFLSYFIWAVYFKLHISFDAVFLELPFLCCYPLAYRLSQRNQWCCDSIYISILTTFFFFYLNFSFLNKRGVVEDMGHRLLLLLFLYSLPGILAQESAEATVVVKGSATVAETDKNFVCATIDWWPPEKCNFNQCPWGESSALNLDIDHPFLANAIKAFKPLRIRVGGSLQDQVVYGLSNSGHPCLPFTKMEDGLFGFSKGCLSMVRWDKLNDLFRKTG